ncbi:MAG: putative porin [Candidatus Polarisedimenticolia bacterium]
MRRAALAMAALVLTLGPLAAQEGGEPGAGRYHPTGDLFVRFEAVRDAPNSLTANFERARLRFRPGMEAFFYQGRLVLGAGILASIASDNNDDNGIRQDNFISDDLAADRLYVRLTAPRAAISGTVGMFETPFAGTQVLWDRDIRFIGAAAGWELPPGRMTGQRVLAAFSKGSQNHEDQSLVGAVRWEGEAGAGFSFGTALWVFGNTDVLVDVGLARTNALVLGGEALLSDYQVADVTIGWEHLGEKRPFRTRFDFLYNFGADDQRTGGDLLVEWGQLQDRGTWRVLLILQRIEQDAALAAFGGDEWWFRTRQRGARLSFAYALARNVAVEASWLQQRRDDLDDWLVRAFVDFTILF